MANSVNKVILVGNLGKDPEVRMTQDGKEILSMTLATSESWKDKSTGERKERTEWHRVVIFNEGLVGIAKNYLRKGSKVYIEGALQTRKWVDQAGAERYTTEIVLQNYNGNLTLLDSRGQSGGESAGNAGYSQNNEGSYSRASTPTSQPNKTVAADLDDDIPF